MGRPATPQDPPSEWSSTLLQGGPPAPARPFPAQVGRYRLVRLLGQGGMGVVYLAEDPRLRRQVALKLIRGTTSGEELARFAREAHLAARLRHPAIAAVLDSGTHQGAPFLVMELIPGRSLRELVRGGRVPAPEEVARWVVTLADALQHAHEAGVLHRDLKPGNVLVDERGPHLVDFGLARRVDGDDSAAVTATGQILGTPAYMSPEQALGDVAQLDARSDVYGLGALLYELLAGRPPFQGESALAVLEAVLAADPTPPSRLRPGVPADLEAVCLRCLEKEPAARYPSAGALGDDLRRWLRGEPVLASRGRRLRRLSRWARRGGARAAATVLVAGLAGAVLVGASAERARRARESVLEAAGPARVDPVGAAESALGLGRLPVDLSALAALGERLGPAGRQQVVRRLVRRTRALLSLDPRQAVRWGEAAQALAPDAPAALYALGRARQAVRSEDDPGRPVTEDELATWYEAAVRAGSQEARAWELYWRGAPDLAGEEASRLAWSAESPELLLLRAELLPPPEACAALRQALARAEDHVLAAHARRGLLRRGESIEDGPAERHPVLEVYLGRAALQAARDREAFERGRERLLDAARHLAELTEADKTVLLQTLAAIGDWGAAYGLATGDRDGSRLQRFLQGLGGGGGR